MKHLPIYLLITAIIIGSLTLAGCGLIQPKATELPAEIQAPVTDVNTLVTAEGNITPREDASLFFTSSGLIAELLVKEGQKVAQGDALIHLGDREGFVANLSAAELELANAQQQYDDLVEKAALAYNQTLTDLTAAQRALTLAQQDLADLDTDDYQDDLDTAKDDVTEILEDLEDAQEEFDKYKDLDPDNSKRENAEDNLEEAQDDYDQAVRDLDLLVNELDQARAKVALAQASVDDLSLEAEARKNGPDPDDLALAAARLDNALAQRAAAQAALERLTLTAPFDGTIVEIKTSLGERVLPNQVVIILADLNTLYVETNDLTENEVAKISEGQAVTIIADALPDLQLSGIVESISQGYGERSGDITYRVRILLDSGDPNLRWGMTVEARFEILQP